MDLRAAGTSVMSVAGNGLTSVKSGGLAVQVGGATVTGGLRVRVYFAGVGLPGYPAVHALVLCVGLPPPPGHFIGHVNR